MSRKKQYKNRLPTVLPPAPRPAPAMESLPPEPPPEPESVIEPQPEAADPPAEPAGPPDEPGPRPRAVLAGLALLGTVIALGTLLAAYVGAPGDTGTGPVGAGATTAARPPGALPEESYVEARVQPGGDIVVRQWIRSEVPLSQVTLGLPEVSGVQLSAVGVEVVADDVRAGGPRTIARGGTTYSFEDSTDVRLRYRLTGAVLRAGSVTGRALAVATTLDVDYRPRPTSETRVVRAPAVLSLACAASSTQSPEPCGSLEGLDQWRVDLAGPRVADRVIAQVTLGDVAPAAATAAADPG